MTPTLSTNHIDNQPLKLANKEKQIKLHEQLTNALSINSLKTIKELIKEGIDLNSKFNDAYPAVLCVTYRALDLMKYLVSCGMNVRCDNDEALRRAVNNEHIPIIDYLIEQGADINVARFNFLKNKDYSKENLMMVKYLVEHDLNIHQRDNEVLRTCAKNGDLECVKYLVSKGANIHALDDYALQWASKFGFLDIVEFLVQQGANIYAENNYSMKWAVCYNHIEVALYLYNQYSDKSLPISIIETTVKENNKHVFDLFFLNNNLNNELSITSTQQKKAKI